jgi:hypothetical protein
MGTTGSADGVYDGAQTDADTSLAATQLDGRYSRPERACSRPQLRRRIYRSQTTHTGAVIAARISRSVQ